MKNLKTLLILTTFYLANCNHEKLVGFVGKLVKTWNKRDSNRNDVIIFNLGDDNDLVNDLVKKISGENAIVFPQKQIDSKLGQPSFIIIISDIFDVNELFSHLYWAVDKNIWSSNSNFIFIPCRKSRITDRNLGGVLGLISVFRFLNTALIYYDGEIKIITHSILTGSTLLLTETSDLSLLFHDRLLNMNGYKYKVLAFNQPPRLMRSSLKVWRGPDKLFMDIATKLQNSTYVFMTYNIKAENSISTFHHYMDRAIVDIFLNTLHTEQTENFYKAVNTFETNGFCALIPAPTRLSYLKYLLTPFDEYIWIYCLTSVTIFAAVWRIFKKRSTNRDFDSAGHFVFGMIALFFLQALPFRRNRPILTFVTQIFVFTMMILGNAYQSLLISLISNPHYGSEITTIDEMVERHQNYEVDGVFTSMIHESNPYPTIKMTNYDVNELLSSGEGVEESAMSGTVYIMKCDVADHVMSMSGLSEMRRLYYILPQKFYSIYETFLTSRYSPFNKRLNEISLNIFETGIRQHWKTLSTEALQVTDSEKDNMLKLGDLVGVFYIYGFCLTIAMIAFFMELLKFRWSKRGEPLMIVRIGRFFGGTKRRRINPEMNIGRTILEPINLGDLDE